MVEHDLDNIKEDKEFLEFIQKQKGYSNFDAIPLHEQDGLLNQFRMQKDISSNEDGSRKREANSDRNEYLVENIQLEILHDMQLIDDDTFNETKSDSSKAMDIAYADYKLTPEQNIEFENRITDKMLNNQELMTVIPPRFLADRYQNLQQYIATKTQENPEYDASEDKRKLSVLEERIDKLTADIANEQGSYFNDVTNIADTYDGYMKMFEEREKYLQDNEKDNVTKDNIATSRATLEKYIKEYDKDWSLENLTENDANRLNTRAQEITKNMQDIELSEENLKLVSNFKFLDENGNPEPQFISPEGEKSDVWQQGYKVDETSKLADVIRLAKQNVLMDNLGSEASIKPENLAEDLNETLPQTLFALHVADKTAQGGLEHPKEFTDKTYLKSFIKDLGNVEKPMNISATGYETGVDGLINNVGGYANRLGTKVGNDKEVVTNLFEPLKDLDKRASQRTTDKKPSKKQVRIEMLKRTLKGAASAFLISGAITTVGTIAASDASLTAATGGMNKLAGAVLGVGLGVTMTALNIRKWRKAQKAAGKPSGFKALIKDTRLLATVATTAMGAAALGFATTGNPAVAQYLGYGALATGVGTGIVTNYKDSKNSGLGTGEAFAWSALQAVATTVAGFGGREAANAGIDWYNQNNPDNNLFQHKETTPGYDKEVVVGREMVIDYGALNENAEQFLTENWYKDHPELLQQRIDALSAAGVKNPHHMLLAAHDAGMRAPDNMLMWDGFPSDGNHTVLTKAWAAENNVPFEDVQAIKNLFDANGNVNPQAIEGYESVKHHIAEDNFVTKITDRPVIRELYGDRESTYDAEHKMPMKMVEHRATVHVDGDSYNVRNQTDLGVGMVGFFATPIQRIKKLRDRIGSLADKIIHKEKPIITPKPISKPLDEPQPIVPEPQQDDKVQKMLMDEYKIVYGISPNMEEGKDTAWKNYCHRVEEERKSNAPNKDMNSFLQDRRKQFDEIFLGENSAVSANDMTKGSPLVPSVSVKDDYQAKADNDDRGKAGIVCEGRQNLMQSNITKENYSNKITLSHFIRFMKEYVVKDSPLKSDASRDISLNPVLKRKYKNQNSERTVIDMNRYLIEGKSVQESELRETNNVKKQTTRGKDLATNMAILNKYYRR